MWGSILQGVGSLASAWGDYKIGKKMVEVEKEKLDYEKDKDKITADKTSQAQAELDGALASVYNVEKKKAKKETGSLSDAFVAPSMV